MGKRMFDFKQTLDGWKQRDSQGQEKQKAPESGAKVQVSSSGSSSTESEETTAPGVGKEGEKETREAYGGLTGVKSTGGRSNSQDDERSQEKKPEEDKAKGQQALQALQLSSAAFSLLAGVGQMMTNGLVPVAFEAAANMLERLVPLAGPAQSGPLSVAANVLRPAGHHFSSSTLGASKLVETAGNFLEKVAADENHPGVAADLLNQAGRMLVVLATRVQHGIPSSLPWTPMPDNPSLVTTSHSGVLPLAELHQRHQIYREAGSALLGASQLASQANARMVQLYHGSSRS